MNPLLKNMIDTRQRMLEKRISESGEPLGIIIRDTVYDTYEETFPVEEHGATREDFYTRLGLEYAGMYSIYPRAVLHMAQEKGLGVESHVEGAVKALCEHYIKAHERIADANWKVIASGYNPKRFMDEGFIDDVLSALGIDVLDRLKQSQGVLVEKLKPHASKNSSDMVYCLKEPSLYETPIRQIEEDLKGVHETYARPLHEQYSTEALQTLKSRCPDKILWNHTSNAATYPGASSPFKDLARSDYIKRKLDEAFDEETVRARLYAQ